MRTDGGREDGYGLGPRRSRFICILNLSFLGKNKFCAFPLVKAKQNRRFFDKYVGHTGLSSSSYSQYIDAPYRLCVIKQCGAADKEKKPRNLNLSIIHVAKFNTYCLSTQGATYHEYIDRDV
jgi:hypothetical protein